MVGMHLFSIFVIKMPPAFAALAPLGLLSVKTLTNVTITCRERCDKFSLILV